MIPCSSKALFADAPILRSGGAPARSMFIGGKFGLADPTSLAPSDTEVFAINVRHHVLTGPRIATTDW